MNSGMTAGRAPLTNSLVKLVTIIKKQAMKACGNGPECQQQMKKHLFKKT